MKSIIGGTGTDVDALSCVGETPTRTLCSSLIIDLNCVHPPSFSTRLGQFMVFTFVILIPIHAWKSQHPLFPLCSVWLTEGTGYHYSASEVQHCHLLGLQLWQVPFPSGVSSLPVS